MKKMQTEKGEKMKRGLWKREKNKRAVSPVVATTLLVAMVVVIGLIIFLWFRSFNQEAVTKFGGTNIDLVCKDVKFDSSYSGGSIFLSNIGNVPVYSFELQIQGAGSSQTLDITNATSSWPNTGLNQGGVFTGDISGSVSGASKMTVIPVLRGTTSKGIRTHVCDSQYGEVITL